MKEKKECKKKNNLFDLKNSEYYTKKQLDLFPDLEIVNIKNLEDEDNE